MFRDDMWFATLTILYCDVLLMILCYHVCIIVLSCQVCESSCNVAVLSHVYHHVMLLS